MKPRCDFLFYCFIKSNLLSETENLLVLSGTCSLSLPMADSIAQMRPTMRY